MFPSLDQERELAQIQLDLEIYILELELEMIRKKKLAKRGKEKRKRRWVRPWLLDRRLVGQHSHLMQVLARCDTKALANFVRLPQELFNEVLERITPRIERQDTWWREAIQPAARLAVTLRFLATGDSYRSLMYSFLISDSTISLIIPEVCEAIIAEFLKEVIVCPKTPEHWRRVS